MCDSAVFGKRIFDTHPSPPSSGDDRTQGRSYTPTTVITQTAKVQASWSQRWGAAMKQVFSLITLSLLCMVVAPVTPAQDTVTGAFEGTITSSLTGDPIEGATVEIINVESGVAILKRSDS